MVYPMKTTEHYLVGAYVEPSELNSIREALAFMGITKVNVTETKEYPPFARHGLAAIAEPSPKVKLEVLVEGEGRQDAVADIFLTSARVRGVDVPPVWYQKVQKYSK